MITHRPIQKWLSPDEMEVARLEGQARHDATQRRGARNNGPQGDFLTQHVLGVMGEIAFSKWSGLPWTASKGGTYDALTPDVGNCEVRTRSTNSDRDMTVKANAQNKYPPSRIYVLTWAHPKMRRVLLVGYTSLGEIFDHGAYRKDWNAMVYPWQNMIDLRTLKND